MSDTGTQRYSSRSIITVCTVFFIILSSWVNAFDDQVRDYVSSAIVQSAALYGSARGINAIISVLQSANFGIGVASVHPAEILDPINDAAEWFSGIMQYAISSAVAQKILLEISSASYVKYAITVTGSLAIAGILVRRTSHVFLTYALKIFISLSFVKFSLLISLALTSVVDLAFLQKRIQDDAVIVANAEREVTDANPASSLPPEKRAGLIERKAALIQERTALETQKRELHHSLEGAQRRLQEIDAALREARDGMSFSERHIPFMGKKENEEIELNQKALSRDVHLKASEISTLERGISDLDGAVLKIDDELSGKGSGFFSGISAYSNAFASSLSYENLANRVNIAIDAMMNLVAAIILKIVVIPLVFLVVVVRIFQRLWGLDPRQLIAREIRYLKGENRYLVSGRSVRFHKKSTAGG